MLIDCRVDVGEGLQQLAQVPLPQPMVDLLSLQDLTGLKLPEMSENDWQVFARCSLPAALQHQMWPVDESLDPSAQVTQHKLLHILAGLLALHSQVCSGKTRSVVALKSLEPCCGVV